MDSVSTNTGNLEFGVFKDAVDVFAIKKDHVKYTCAYKTQLANSRRAVRCGELSLANG